MATACEVANATFSGSDREPASLIRREAREIVASFYQREKNDPAYAAVIRRGERDMIAEVRQAEAAIARAFHVAGAWMDVQEPGQCRGHRLAEFATNKS